MKRRPPLPPPATSTRQVSSGHKPLSFVRPPPQRTGSASESSFVPSERGPLRLRVWVEDTPPQRQMPRRTLATPVGCSAPPRPESTSHRPAQGDYQGQSQVRDDRSSQWERSGEWHDQRDYPERSRSRQWQGDQQWTERSRYQQERQDWGSTQGWTPGASYRDTGSQSQWRDQHTSSQRYQDWSQQPQNTQGGWQDPHQGHQAQQQQVTATQYWPTQQQQPRQQQLPTLPAPVYQPGMQPTNVQPPPGLGHTGVQQTWRGATTQNALIQFGSAATRQQSPFGSQPTQGSAADRQQSPFGQQPQQSTGRSPFNQGYQ